MNTTSIGAIARLDFAEVRRSRWLIFNLVVYAVVAGVFVLVGLRESSVLGFTGTGRVLLSFAHALVLVLPLLALTAAGQVVQGARDSGSLELLLSQPIGRWDYFVGVSLVRLAVLALPLILLTVAVALYAHFALGSAIPWSFLLRTLAVGTALLVAFVGIGMLIATASRSAARATIAVLVVWMASVALLDFALAGMMLQWRLPPRLVFVLTAINPVESARLAILAGIEPELSSFGPVGFYLANKLGHTALMLVGILWPLTVGAGSWLLAGFLFRRRDAV